MTKRVLIADDEPNIVASLEFLMEQAGFEVKVAADGGAALALVASFRPDLVLLDVMMPVKNGYEVCQQLKSDPATRGVKVILLSAKGRDVEVAKGLELGADAYVTKPFSTRELVAKVKELLGADEPRERWRRRSRRPRWRSRSSPRAPASSGAISMPSGREAIAAILTPPRIGLLVLFALVLATALAILGYRLFARLAAPARRLAEDVRVIAQGNAAHRVAPSGAAELQALAGAVNELAEVRSALAADVAATVADANARVEAERSRLAALIAELDQSVLVCNREGRILLYNAAAQRILGGGDASLLGLGRSVFGIVDRNLILHAVEAMERQLERKEREGTHFVTATGDGRLLRVQAAPVPEQAAGASGRERPRRLRPAARRRDRIGRRRVEASRALPEARRRDAGGARQHPRGEREPGGASGDGGGTADALRGDHPGRGGTALRSPARDHRRRLGAPQGPLAPGGDARRGSPHPRA